MALRTNTRMRNPIAGATILVASLFATAVSAQELQIAETRFPDINCIFDTDCRITARDFVDEFDLPGANGKGRLQSRLWPTGEAGTAGVGLTSYLYRIDLTNTAGILDIPCVRSMRLDFGDVVPLDYDADRGFEHVFVGAAGGLGAVGPARAVKSGRFVDFSFRRLCAGASSYFFGLASANPPREITLQLGDGRGTSISVNTQAPQAPVVIAPPGSSVRLCVPGFPGLMVDPDAPVCRCLADRSLREFSCALVSPDLFLAFRTPFPVPYEKPVTVQWMLMPLTERVVEVSISVPQNSSFRQARQKNNALRLKSAGAWKPARGSQRLIMGKPGEQQALTFEVLLPGSKQKINIVAIPPDGGQQ